MQVQLKSSKVAGTLAMPCTNTRFQAPILGTTNMAIPDLTTLGLSQAKPCTNSSTEVTGIRSDR